MTGYYGFPSKEEYEKYYSGLLPKWEIDAMGAYTREAEEERTLLMQDLTQEVVRLTALDRAIQSNSGEDYDNEGRSITNPDKILEAAKKFEAYLKGTTTNDREN